MHTDETAVVEHLLDPPGRRDRHPAAAAAASSQIAELLDRKGPFTVTAWLRPSLAKDHV